MIKTWVCALFFLTLLMGWSLFAKLKDPLSIAPTEAEKIGYQIWHNECAGTIQGLTTWNKGEEFASLGIGHFIWYPEGYLGPFKQTFPDLLSFTKTKGFAVPDWLRQAKGCPWKTREEFQLALAEPKMAELRKFLVETIEIQIEFMIFRLQQALGRMLENLPESRQQHMVGQFYRLTQTPAGVYALLDYLNFKGEGLSSKECYAGEGWGLCQVLQKMSGSTLGQSAVEEFVVVAKGLLTKRVKNAPPGRQEERWLKGWFNRLDTYARYSASIK